MDKMLKVLKFSLPILDSGMVKTSIPLRAIFCQPKTKCNANNVCPVIKWSQWQVRDTKL